MTITEEKKSLRRTMLEQRGKIDPVIKQEYDQWICSELEKVIRQQNFKSVHAYIPMANEIDIRPLIEQLLLDGITVISPKTLSKRKLENRILHSLNEVEIGIMGTKHPMQPEPYEGKPDLIIVPGLAFDKAKYRLGYGGGYYDNFLHSQTNSYKVGIFYPFQQVDITPVEPHDVSLDTILVKDF